MPTGEGVTAGLRVGGAKEGAGESARWQWAVEAAFGVLRVWVELTWRERCWSWAGPLGEDWSGHRRRGGRAFRLLRRARRAAANRCVQRQVKVSAEQTHTSGEFHLTHRGVLSEAGPEQWLILRSKEFGCLGHRAVDPSHRACKWVRPGEAGGLVVRTWGVTGCSGLAAYLLTNSKCYDRGWRQEGRGRARPRFGVREALGILSWAGGWLPPYPASRRHSELGPALPSPFHLHGETPRHALTAPADPLAQQRQCLDPALLGFMVCFLPSPAGWARGRQRRAQIRARRNPIRLQARRAGGAASLVPGPPLRNAAAAGGVAVKAADVTRQISNTYHV